MVKRNKLKSIIDSVRYLELAYIQAYDTLVTNIRDRKHAQHIKYSFEEIRQGILRIKDIVDEFNKVKK